MDKEILMFSHIPKTAGTSLNYLLRAYFQSSLMAARYRKNFGSPVYTYQNFMSDRRLFTNLRCVSGHSIKPFVSFNEYEKHMKWVTFLRNPKERFISHYIHQYTSNNPLFKVNIEQWALRFKRSNWMVRHIAGEENLDKAIEIIENKFVFVGYTEFFDESLALMKQRLNLVDFNTYYSRRKMIVRNDTLKRKIINSSKEIEDLIMSQNELDFQLYEYFLKDFHLQSLSIENKRDTSHTYDKQIGNFKFNIQDKIIYKGGSVLLDFMNKKQ